MEFAPGDTLARIVPVARVPTVTATPTSAPAGSVVRLSVGGFNPGAQIKVSITGQQDFLAIVPNGDYIWENYIPAATNSSSVTIKAIDLNSQVSSQTSYAIRGGNDARLSLKAVLGDTQTGLPGATLPLKIQVLYADDAGNPIPNAAVRFTPSPGGQLGADLSTVTDANGVASASWRLPSEVGVALLSVNASGRLLNVSARAAHSSLTNFPVLSQAGNGALLVSATAAIRYFQNRGEMPAPLGLADATALNTYLKSACVADATGAPICDGFLQPPNSNDQIANLWRLRGFVGNQLDIRTIAPDDKPVRDAIAQGWPVILALSLTQNGAPNGSHFVVATGVDSSGNLSLMDPTYGQISFYSYLNGFQTKTGIIAGTLTGAAVVSPQMPANPGFLVAVSAPTSIQAPSGLCGAGFMFPVSNGAFTLHYCDASTAGLIYELDMQATDSGSNFQGGLIDLGSSGGRADFSGSGPASFAIDRSTGQWTIAPLTVQFQASGVINSASHATDLAPGGLASIIGSGFASPGAQPVIAVNGEYTPVLKATPFQLDFQIPTDAVAGQAVLDVVSDLSGSAEQIIILKPVAPAIQLLDGLRKGRIANQDGSANSRYKPATRGQSVAVFGTGFGPLAPPRGLATVLHAFIGGAEVAVTAVTQVPDSPGLYQLTLSIPANLTPGLSLELVLQQGDSMSNAVDVAIQ